MELTRVQSWAVRATLAIDGYASGNRVTAVYQANPAPTSPHARLVVESQPRGG
jgi:hypothetical protein